jgi:predicted DNA-binding protein
MPVVTFSIADETEDRINALAKATHRTRSGIVDLAVEQLVQQEQYSQVRIIPTAHKVRRTKIDQIVSVRKGLPIKSEVTQ